MSSSHRPAAVFKHFLDASVNNDWDAVADTYAEDAVVEIPFAPPGVPTTTKGREVLRARFKGAGKIFTFSSADPVVVRETDDREVIVAEYTLHGTAIPTGKTFSFTYIMVVTVRHGEIVHSRDYSNPLASAVVLDRLPALVEAMTAQ
jgi:ketosteroid isomerase-like protein